MGTEPIQDLLSLSDEQVETVRAMQSSVLLPSASLGDCIRETVMDSIGYVDDESDAIADDASDLQKLLLMSDAEVKRLYAYFDTSFIRDEESLANLVRWTLAFTDVWPLTLLDEYRTCACTRNGSCANCDPDRAWYARTKKLLLDMTNRCFDFIQFWGIKFTLDALAFLHVAREFGGYLYISKWHQRIQLSFERILRSRDDRDNFEYCSASAARPWVLRRR
jgi:hypothetical protein